jgi:hypothetical protein
MTLHRSEYIDRRIASNVSNMGSELHDIAHRLQLIGFNVEAAVALRLAGDLTILGLRLRDVLGDERMSGAADIAYPQYAGGGAPEQARGVHRSRMPGEAGVEDALRN